MPYPKKPPLPASFKDPRALAALPPDTPMVLALSGGADSVALLAMLSDDQNLVALHIHHGIRGAEADRDERFCREIAEKLGVPFYVTHLDVPALARAKRQSLETAAREARYAAFTAFMREKNIPLLLTAHHADDQFETMLLNLARGCGLGGLCGIPPCRALGDGMFAVRPLLLLTRDDLRQYLTECELPFITDSTNEEPFCKRNRLRLDVMPRLASFDGEFARRAARCAETLREDEEYLSHLAAEFLRNEGEEPRLAALAALPPPIFSRVMKLWLPLPPEGVHLHALAKFCKSAKPHKELALPGVLVRAEDGRLTRAPRAAEPISYEVEIDTGENPLPDGSLVILAKLSENSLPQTKGFYKYSTSVYFSSAIINGRLRLRPRRAGDRILSGGVHKEVRKLPEWTALPLDLRRRIPLLLDDDGIVAAPFAKLRDGAKDRPDTVLTLYMNPEFPPSEKGPNLC